MNDEVTKWLEEMEKQGRENAEKLLSEINSNSTSKENKMKISEMFPTKYLKAEDVGTLPAALTISDVLMEPMQDGLKKPVLKFHEIKQGLICNKTRCTALLSITGSDESTAWINHRISLFVGEENFKGDVFPSIRIKAAAPVQARSRPLPVNKPAEEEIPF